VIYLTFACATHGDDALGERRKAMDEQPSTQTPSWFTIDLTIIALSAIVIVIGIWMGL
jgi:hypothetical protein